MTHNIALPIFIPIAGALVVAILPNRIRWAKEIAALMAMLATMVQTAFLFNKTGTLAFPWAGFGIELTLRLYQFSAFIILATAFFGLAITLYAVIFMKDHPHAKQFHAYLLISVALVCGAALADNLVALLFFWEGLTITTFGMIAIGSRNAFKAATKALIIVGLSDLCMMVGIAITGTLAGTLTISQINLPVSGLGGLALVLLVIGAIAKAGSMPFHTWIPDSATAAPLPFMAILPGSLEKLLGIYFLTRISLDLFRAYPHSWASTMLMVIGSITILAAVMMALIQKDYKKLLAYHAICQVGYMVLGIGTLVPAGIVGGLFHTINNALYKSGLFLTAGSVERQAGTTDLERLGGLGAKMPITFISFIIVAASISGVPPFNGFFSKELVYDGALQRGMIYYIAAALGSFLTAASFLKLGHAAYLGKRSKEGALVREAPLGMLIPMVVIAAICILFGVWNALPLEHLIQPILGARLEGHNFAGWPTNAMVVIVTIVVLGAALANHLYGVRRYGSGVKAVDHIHYAPGLKTIYGLAEKGWFDPYNIGMKTARAFSIVATFIDRAINWIYDTLSVNTAYMLAAAIERLYNGNYKTYLVWSVAATALIIILLLR